MPLLPNNRRYNEFAPEDKSKIDQLALDAAEANKDYLDKELKPFLKGRTIIMYGIAGKYDASKGVLEVSIAGEEGSNSMVMKAVGCPKAQATKVRGKSVRVLFDTRSKTVYFDDQAF